jgi:hypothetical protein
MIGQFLRLVGFASAFLICGAVGGAVVLSAVPELRDKCSGGIVCIPLQWLRVIPQRSSEMATKEVAATSLDAKACLNKNDRIVMYRLGVILTGDPAPEAAELPASLELNDAGCVSVESAAASICTYLAHQWWASPATACLFERK